MKERDLEVYDVWEAPNGNLFIKMTDEYSLAIGQKGFHGPHELGGDLNMTQYVERGEFTEVKKIGRIVFEENKLLRNELDVLHDVLLGALNYPNDDLTDEFITGIWTKIPEDIKKDAAHWGIDDSVVRDNIYVWVQENKKELYESSTL